MASHLVLPMSVLSLFPTFDSDEITGWNRNTAMCCVCYCSCHVVIHTMPEANAITNRDHHSSLGEQDESPQIRGKCVMERAHTSLAMSFF